MIIAEKESNDRENQFLILLLAYIKFVALPLTINFV
jgi:hypothetical protein